MVRPDLPPDLPRERGEREDVLAGAVQVSGDLRELLAQGVQDPVELRAGRVRVRVVIDAVQQCFTPPHADFGVAAIKLAA
jgi:hypothetical protein